MAKPKSWVQKFREAAREDGADESEERFNATLKDLAKRSRESKTSEDDEGASGLTQPPKQPQAPAISGMRRTCL
jgi:hypothetical protein